MSEEPATYSVSGAAPSNRLPPEATFTPAPIRYRVWDGERMHDADDVASRYVFCGGEWYADWRDFEDGTAIVGAVALLSTGLRDADGREVFEGDLWLPPYWNRPVPVSRDPETGGWEPFIPEYCAVDGLTREDAGSGRVVGNAYQGIAASGETP